MADPIDTSTLGPIRIDPSPNPAFEAWAGEHLQALSRRHIDGVGNPHMRKSKNWLDEIALAAFEAGQKAGGG